MEFEVSYVGPYFEQILLDSLHIFIKLKSQITVRIKFLQMDKRKHNFICKENKVCLANKKNINQL